MKRLISFGKGFQFVGDTSQEPAPTMGDLPKLPQPVRRIKSERMSIFRPMKDGNGYRPGPLLDLGSDQCKFTVRDTTMCGAKVAGRASYCEHHAFIARWGSRAMEAAE